MNQQDLYIEHVKRGILASASERDRLENDLRAHFREGAERGETVTETIAKLGTSESVSTSFNLERDLEYAGFWVRLAAFMIDCLLFLLVLSPIVAGAVFATQLNGQVHPVTIVAVVFGGLMVFAFSFLYFPLLEARFGKTLGKHVMKIRVVDEKRGPISMGQAIIRRFSLWLEILAIDALFIPFTEQKQRAFDIVAKTIVVNEPADN